MIKFAYVVALGIMSFLLFIFSKDKVEVTCGSSIKGKIELIKDSAQSYFGIIAEDNTVYFPTSMADGVVLAAGREVVICCEVDSLSFNFHRNAIPVHIGEISYQSAVSFEQ